MAVYRRFGFAMMHKASLVGCTPKNPRSPPSHGGFFFSVLDSSESCYLTKKRRQLTSSPSYIAVSCLKADFGALAMLTEPSDQH